MECPNQCQEACSSRRRPSKNPSRWSKRRSATRRHQRRSRNKSSVSTRLATFRAGLTSLSQSQFARSPRSASARKSSYATARLATWALTGITQGSGSINRKWWPILSFRASRWGRTPTDMSKTRSSAHPGDTCSDYQAMGSSSMRARARLNSATLWSKMCIFTRAILRQNCEEDDETSKEHLSTSDCSFVKMIMELSSSQLWPTDIWLSLASLFNT